MTPRSRYAAFLYESVASSLLDLGIDMGVFILLAPWLMLVNHCWILWLCDAQIFRGLGNVVLLFWASGTLVFVLYLAGIDYGYGDTK
jgi:hypothetical protein